MEKLKCKICGFEDTKSILSHVRKIHKMDAKEYRKHFPDSPLRIAWVNSSTEAMNQFKKVGQANSVLRSGKPAWQLKEGQWSLNHQKCISCGTTKIKHQGMGLCWTCYMNQHALKATAKKNDQLSINGLDSVDFVTCQICNLPFECLTTHGHLKMHHMTVPEYQERFPGAKTRSKKSLEKLSASVKLGRLDLMKRRGYLNPQSQRDAKSKEMSARHSEKDFARISNPEKRVADWFLLRGYNVILGEDANEHVAANSILWQYNWNKRFCVDFACPAKMIVVEVLGDWWHGWEHLQGRQVYDSLHAQVKKNLFLDKKRFLEIRASDWQFVQLWEHQIKDDSYQKILGDIFPSLEIPRDGRLKQTAEDILIESSALAPVVSVRDIARGYRENLNARWLINTGVIEIDKKSQLTKEDALLLRQKLDAIGNNTAIPAGTLEETFQYARSIGFPYQKATKEEMLSQWQCLLKYKIDHSNLTWIGAGTQLATLFHPHLFECRRTGKLSPVEFYNSDTDLKRGIDKILCLRGSLSESNLREICRNENASSRVNNFPPLVAKAIIETVMGERTDIRVLDPCAGFSGRLIGCASSALVAEYTGIDISQKTYNGLVQSAIFLKSIGSTMESKVICGDCLVELPKCGGGFDLVLTSPPHYDLEEYDGVKLPDVGYRGWLEKFITPLISAMKWSLSPSGKICLYLEKIHGFDFPSDAEKIAMATGLKINDHLPFTMSLGEHLRSTKTKRSINIAVWSLPS